MVNNPECLEVILKTQFDAFEKGPVFRSIVYDSLRNGIFSTDGEVWKSQRKLISHIFNVKNFKEYVNHVFSEHEEKLVSLLVEHCEIGDTFDLADLFYRLTFDSFMQILLGFQCDSLSTKEVDLMNAFDAIERRLAERFITPLWEVTEYLSGDASKHKGEVTLLRDFTFRMIQEKRSRGLAENDLLALLMQVRDEQGNLASDNDLIDNVLSLLMAGRNTTAGTLSWAFFMLHENPKVLLKLRDEISAVLKDTTPSYEQIRNKMPYANAVVHETLRLYPQVPDNLRTASIDVMLPDGTFVPKGSFVNWHPYTMGRTEAIWGFDAKQFRPERWLEMEKQPSPFDYPVFHAGPRVCLGKQMAELEIVYVMVELVRKFDFEVLDPASVGYVTAVTLPIKNGLKVRCRLRD
ncbi:cytochrome P450 [Chytriomyces sp. MP71]|nr:cytochrome P450 [Chytriomyces sp. MP71]